MSVLFQCYTFAMKQIAIEVANQDDAEAIRHVQHDVWIDTYPNDKLGITVDAIKKRASKYITPKLIEKLKKSMMEPNQCTWVAREGSKVIGYCTAKKNEEINQLGAIYLMPAYHGKGVGKKLIEALLEWLGNDKDILAEVASYNNRAISFYEKYGFKKNGVTGFLREIPIIELMRSKKH
jgi:ribosomal protein S18 acetylase RimI-like enzyme